MGITQSHTVCTASSVNGISSDSLNRLLILSYTSGFCKTLINTQCHTFMYPSKFLTFSAANITGAVAKPSLRSALTGFPVNS